MQRSSRAVAASKRNRTKKKGKAAVYLRLFLCIAIIGAAVVLKHVNMPITEKLIQVVSDELKVDEAELEERKNSMPIKQKTDIKGALARYASMVSSADKGAIINQFV